MYEKWDKIHFEFVVSLPKLIYTAFNSKVNLHV